MTNELTSRSKPELPKYLLKFDVFYRKLEQPLGPIYLGNFHFSVNKTLPLEIRLEIKESQATTSVIEMTKSLVERGYAVQAERIASHYTKYDDTKLWVIKEWDYLDRFEKMNSIRHPGHEKGFGTHPRDFYKPFIVWAIEAGYAHWQLAEILGRTTPTIRNYANQYGYKEHERAVAKTPDLSDKKSRTTTERQDPVTQGVLFDGQHIDNSHHVVKIRRGDVKNEQPELTHQDEEKIRQYGQMCLLGERLGIKSLTIAYADQPFITIKSIDSKSAGK